MDIREMEAFFKTFPQVTCNSPFGPQSRCYRIGGRIFADICPGGIPGALRILLKDETIERERMAPMLTVRCEPLYGDFWRKQFPGVVLRPYHTPPAQQPYANTVLLTGEVPDDTLKEMIAHSYDYCLKKLPKRRQQEIISAKKEP